MKPTFPSNFDLLIDVLNFKGLCFSSVIGLFVHRAGGASNVNYTQKFVDPTLPIVQKHLPNLNLTTNCQYFPLWGKDQLETIKSVCAAA